MNEATLEFIRIHADEDVRQLAFLGKKTLRSTWRMPSIR